MSGMWNDTGYYFCIETKLSSGVSVPSIISYCVAWRNILCISDAVSEMVSYWSETGRYDAGNSRFDIPGQMGMDENIIGMKEEKNA